MKKKDAAKAVSAVIWIGMLVLAGYIVIKGLSLDKKVVEKIMYNMQQQAVETYLPAVTRSDRQNKSFASWILEKTKDQLPGLAADEQDENARPALKTTIDNLDDYDVIFLGYPNWWGDMPMPLYTFLEAYDFSDKMIIPFNTHGGSRFSRSDRDDS